MKDIAAEIPISRAQASQNLSGKIPSHEFILALLKATVADPLIRERRQGKAMSLWTEASAPRAKPTRTSAGVAAKPRIEVETYDQLVRALERQADLERARGNSQNLIMVMLGMLDQLQRKVNDLTLKNEQLVANRASAGEIEETRLRLERAEQQRERAELELQRAQEKRRQAEQLAALVQQQVAQLTDELDRLRKSKDLSESDTDSTTMDDPQALDDEAADIDNALDRATAVNDSDDQTLHRIAQELSDDEQISTQVTSPVGESGEAAYFTVEPTGRLPQGDFSSPRVISATKQGKTHATPPHDFEAEALALGCMLISADAAADIVEVVGSEDYYHAAHQLIHETVAAMYARRETVNPETVSATLEENGKLSQAGGMTYLHKLVLNAPTDLSEGEAHAETVHEQAVLRRLIDASSHISQLSYSSERDVQEIIETAQAEISAVARHRGKPDYSALGDIMEGTLDEIEGIGKPESHILGLSTGLPDLDVLINGLQPGKLTVVAAGTAMGKTTFATDLIRACAIRENTPSLFFSLQTGRNEVATRILSAEARVAIHHMQSGLMTDEDWTRLARVMPQVTGAPLFIDDSSSPPVEEIKAKTRRSVADSGVRLVVIDSVQLIQHESESAEELRFSANRISRDLRLMARHLDVAVVAISELELTPNRRTDLQPTTEDLREWQSLEQNADAVILLHREDAYEKESPRAGEADFTVAKNRTGPTGRIVTAFQGHYSRFASLSQ
ncbi:MULTISPECIES: DnaB-like helicase C-terminal domain-containing protein [unclassified Streptomyces]|uniref:DnaB-like helicase C-terminal domain-containing protein n=1 Tax=unclassified Streptomyces TaxID=2593676 RepID=UPI0015A22FF2|nr:MULTISPECIES: DnaB-like helicase C-terminal domain-containing protein [unclassified Streptomyces]